MSALTRSLAFALLVGLSAASLAGCGFRPTAAQRSASFAALSVDDDEKLRLREAIQRRTVALYAGDVGWMTHNGRRVFAAFGEYTTGTGAIVSNDGYILTAAHCVDDTPLFVWYYAADGGAASIAPARVVWTGERNRPMWKMTFPWAPADYGRDVALIKIDLPTGASVDPFRWAPIETAAVNEPIVAAGYQERSGRTVVEVMAGRVIPPLPHQPVGMAEVLMHSAPVTRGDSGGPLLTPIGDLAAINVGWSMSPFRRTRGVALRPDPAWVERLISEDRARVTPPTTPAAADPTN